MKIQALSVEWTSVAHARTLSGLLFQLIANMYLHMRVPEGLPRVLCLGRNYLDL
jgi:hypothetical protein